MSSVETQFNDEIKRQFGNKVINWENKKFRIKLEVSKITLAKMNDQYIPFIDFLR